MSGTPRLSNQAAAAATAPIATPVVLVDLDFATGPFRVWTGLGPLDWAGSPDGSVIEAHIPIRTSIQDDALALMQVTNNLEFRIKQFPQLFELCFAFRCTSMK